MAHCSIPLRPRSLALLIHERETQDLLDIYRGNLLWSVLQDIHFLCGHELTLPTYGDMYAELRGIKDTHKDTRTEQQIADDVIAALEALPL